VDNAPLKKIFAPLRICCPIFARLRFVAAHYEIVAALFMLFFCSSYFVLGAVFVIVGGRYWLTIPCGYVLIRFFAGGFYEVAVLFCPPFYYKASCNKQYLCLFIIVPLILAYGRRQKRDFI